MHGTKQHKIFLISSFNSFYSLWMKIQCSWSSSRCTRSSSRTAASWARRASIIGLKWKIIIHWHWKNLYSLVRPINLHWKVNATDDWRWESWYSIDVWHYIVKKKALVLQSLRECELLTLGRNLGGGVLILRSALERFRTTFEWIAQLTQ